MFGIKTNNSWFKGGQWLFALKGYMWNPKKGWYLVSKKQYITRMNGYD